jgi:hypothetical protein
MLLLDQMRVLWAPLAFCSYSLVISFRLVNLAADKSLDEELKESKSATLPAHRFNLVTAYRRVIKAIETAYGREPSGRKVTEPAAIASTTPRIMDDYVGLISPPKLCNSSSILVKSLKQTPRQLRGSESRV